MSIVAPGSSAGSVSPVSRRSAGESVRALCRGECAKSGRSTSLVPPSPPGGSPTAPVCIVRIPHPKFKALDSSEYGLPRNEPAGEAQIDVVRPEDTSASEAVLNESNRITGQEPLRSHCVISVTGLSPFAVRSARSGGAERRPLHAFARPPAATSDETRHKAVRLRGPPVRESPWRLPRHRLSL